MPVYGLIEYIPSANTSYTYNRQHYLVGDLINGSKAWNISVYSLIDSLVTSCKVTITEEGVTPLSGYYLRLDRYIPGTGNNHLSAMGNTTDAGYDTISLRLTDAWYNLGVYDRNNVSVYSSGNQHIPSCPISIQVGSTSGISYNQSEEWFDYDNVNWDLTFNDSNNVTTLIYNSLGVTNNNCFRVERWLLSQTGRTIIYDECLTADTGTMNYTIVNGTGLYIAKYIAYQSSGWKLIGSLDIDLASSISDYMGLDGVFLSMLLIGVLAFIGLYSPVASVMLAIVGFVATRALGLITISWGAIIGIIFVGLLLLFKQKGR